MVYCQKTKGVLAVYRVEDHPEIQKNYFLASRGKGASKRLRGRVVLLSCFLQRGGRPFSEDAKRNYYAALRDATLWLEEEAKKFRVPLTLESMHFDIPVAKDATPRDGFRLVKDFLRSATVKEAQEYYEKRLGADETPFLLVFDEEGRSFAFEEAVGLAAEDELSVVFRKKDGYSSFTVIHELLHQFGAQDLYFPAAVRERAERYFQNSIMGIGKQEMDDLTAYLIGWKDTVSAATYWFLKDTLWLDAKGWCDACSEEWKKK